MSLLSKFIEKFNEPDPESKQRLEAQSLNDILYLPGDYNRVELSPRAVYHWRTVTAERLGREFSDTPMPGVINGREIWVNDDLQPNEVRLYAGDQADVFHIKA